MNTLKVAAPTKSRRHGFRLKGLGIVVTAAPEKLAHYSDAAVAFLVEIDFAVFHGKHAKVGYAVADANLRQNIMHQIGMQRVVRGKMSNVLTWQWRRPNVCDRLSACHPFDIKL